MYLPYFGTHLAKCLNSVLNVKALEGAFNQEKALVGAFYVIVKSSGTIGSDNLRFELYPATTRPAVTTVGILFYDAAPVPAAAAAGHWRCLSQAALKYGDGDNADTAAPAQSSRQPRQSLLHLTYTY